MSELWIASMISLWVLLAFAIVLLAGALRQLGIIQLRLGEEPGALITTTGLDRGSLAPDITGKDPDTGNTVRLADLPKRARAIVFLSPGCLSCEQLVPHLNEVVDVHGNEFDWLVVCQGSQDECRAFRNQTKMAPSVIVDDSGDAERAYQVELTPFMYLLDWQGRVMIRGVVNNWTQLESMLDQEGTLEPARPSAQET
ncbi:MAG TPA: redoxin domain-containing protein [Candidatus Limnocylindrales bacterium]